MRAKKTALMIGLLYVVTMIYAFMIGRYETAYGAGAAVVIVIQLVAAISFLVVYFTSGRKLISSLQWSFVIAITLQLALIAYHRITSYQPMHVISLSEEQTGCIYLFVTTEERDDCQVNEYGVAYMGSQGKSRWRIERGKEDHTNAFLTSQRNEILLYDTLDQVIQMTAYDVSCINILDDLSYPVSYEEHIPCMDATEFKELVNEGIIDESRLRKRVWQGSGDNKDWQLISDLSRL